MNTRLVGILIDSFPNILINGLTVTLPLTIISFALALVIAQILQCYRVTGSYNFIVKVSCPGIDALEHLLTHLQKMGNTNTQIILATPLDRSLSLEGDV